MSKSRNILSTLIAIIMFSNQAHASGEIGTTLIEYAPISSSGVTTGCSLIFTATFLDTIHKQGAPVVLNGNISINGFPEKNALIMTYKLAIRDVITGGLGNPYPPYFVFLKTAAHTTSKSKFVPNDSDIPGYRIYAVELDNEALGVLEDMVAEKKVFIGYNLSKGGTDAVVPLDLTVKDIKVIKGDMKRSHSNEAIEHYANCLGELAEQF